MVLKSIGMLEDFRAFDTRYTNNRHGERYGYDKKIPHLWLGIAHLFRFLVSVPDPNPVLGACDFLVQPSRNSDPRGREVFEAMVHGLPVIAMGEYDKFVESGVIGCIQAEFDAEVFADDIITLADDDDVRAAMSVTNRDDVSTICDGPTRSSDLAQVWRGLCERP
jgi:glycosyltransferase involved in cell wall biosynthesis